MSRVILGQEQGDLKARPSEGAEPVGPCGANCKSFEQMPAEPASPLWQSSNDAVRDLSRALNENKGQESRRGTKEGIATLPYGQCDIAVRDGGDPERLGTHFFHELAQPGGFRRQHLVPGNPDHFRKLASLSQSYVSFITSIYDGDKCEIGDTGTLKITGAILKVFLCSAIMFLPKGFVNGGWLFSPIALSFFCAVCSHCVVQLIQVRALLGHGTFGELARKTLGRVGVLVDISICFSQFGYCTALALFTARVFSTIFSLPISVCVGAQLFLLAPLCCIRKVRILAIPALIADVLVMVGLLSVAGVAIHHLANNGIAESIVAVAPEGPIFLGTAIYSFEGIGNIMPMYNSMRDKEKFCGVFIACMTGITSLFIAFALTCYLAYGADMQTVAVFILPDSHWGNNVAVAYAVAVALSFPLVLLPATHICSDAIFQANRIKPSFKQKMSKNLFITFLVVFILWVSWVGQANLNNLVSFIGSFCCVPLGLLYPPCMHLQAFPNQSIMSKAVKYAELALGSFCLVFTSYMALSTF